jgi:predicted extracellular nuclease
VTGSLPRRVVLPIVATAAAIGVTVAVAPWAGAEPSTDGLIAEVYGGGGNSGATLTHDFVELANGSQTALPLDGMSVQYLPAAPTPTSRWQVTPLTGSVAPGARYLVAEGKGAGGTVGLPTPDATGSINMSGGSGTVALVTGTEPLSCRTTDECAADTRIRDLVGYGSAAVREGAAVASTSATTSAARAELTDTDDNSADFATGEPTPVNSKGETPDNGGGEPDPDPAVTSIAEIQGTSRVSPLAGKPVTGVGGVVTAIRAFGDSRGFWFQSAQPDEDSRTSEGLFVYTAKETPAVKVGDAVEVSGTVKEFYPDNPESSVFQSVTEIIDAQFAVKSSGNPVPAAELIDENLVPSQYSPSADGGSIEPLELAPDTYALDFWESREGTSVKITDARVVGPTTEFNELYLTTKPNENPSVRGGTVYLGYHQPNAGRLKLQSLIPFSEVPFPKANVGDTFTGETVGVVDYAKFGGYTLQATALGQLTPGGNEPEVTRKQGPDELAVATYNVENLDPSDDQAKFDRLAAGVVTNLASPDIVVLEEVQDDNGATDDGTVTAGATLGKLTETIAAAGGPRYEFRQIDPADKTDGGEPGGNIRVAFLFNPAKVSFVDRPGGDATTPVAVVGDKGRPALSVSPGRIDPANPAWESSRKPLAGEFTFHGKTLFVVANHFNSKGGDQPMHGRFQAPNRTSEIQRSQQAASVRAFVDEIAKLDPKANVIIAGDLNDYQFSPAVGKLTDGGLLRALIDTLPEAERYSYVFEGNSQVLDHLLASQGMKVLDYDVVHLNAEFHDQVSDHDPQILRTRLAGRR